MSDRARRVGQLRRWGAEVRGVANAGAQWRRRQGLVLRVEEAGGGGLVGLGEASPLPGYSPDSLAEAEAELRHWIDGGCPEDTATLRSPSARCAVETALLDLRGRRHDQPLWRLLDGVEAPPPMPVAGLIPPAEVVDTVARARSLVAQGIGTLKLKVGCDVAAEARRLEALRAEFGERILLRLDANRGLDETQALHALRTWSAFDIELIEEPGPAAGLESSPIPLAFDESLQGRGSAEQIWQRLASRIAREPWVALVLKPTVLGLGKARELAGLARAEGLDLLVSHTFEGPVALQAWAHLALALGSRRACGLARHSALDSWPAAEGLLIGAHQIDATRALGPALGLDAESLWQTLPEALPGAGP